VGVSWRSLEVVGGVDKRRRRRVYKGNERCRVRTTNWCLPSHTTFYAPGALLGVFFLRLPHCGLGDAIGLGCFVDCHCVCMCGVQNGKRAQMRYRIKCQCRRKEPKLFVKRTGNMIVQTASQRAAELALASALAHKQHHGSPIQTASCT
jgi:hypothetical protein